MTSRRERIEEMLKDDPADIFLRYSLALEWQKEGEFVLSQAGLRDLMGGSPPYVPAFFMAAKFLAEQSEIEPARTVLRQGIEAARSQGDMHAAGEMSEFLATLGSF
ncbi:MAG: hypothetical protein O2931_02675 [Planctomycetota bacterium]|nr:hypothetical protein [Planctomycetota bacterium]MDA1177680.1 hypothetical protein [Planctomycetota bacterium]